MNEPPLPPQQLQPQHAAPPPQVPKTNGMSVAALVSGILGLTMCPGLGSILALIFGYVGRGQIKRAEGREGGSGIAVAGIVLGWIGIILAVLFFAAMALGALALFNVDPVTR